MSRSQTATEYLIIIALVVIISLVVLGTLSDVPFIGSRSSSDVTTAELSTRDVGISHTAFTADWSKFELRNNKGSYIKINSIWVDQKPCATNTVFPLLMPSGKTKMITCWNIRTADENFQDIVVEYVDIDVNATRNTKGEAVALYKGTTVDDCFGVQTVSGVYDICTCDDLAMIDDNSTTLAYDYALRNNIDFKDSACESYRAGSGWTPLGNYSSGEEYVGFFNGYYKTISNLYINLPAVNGVGLFGDITDSASVYGNISRLGLVNSDITGSSYVGGLVGYGANADLFDSYSIGSISGTTRVGGLVGHGDNANVSNSYSVGTVTGSSSHVGGLVGNTLSDGFIINSYSRNTVSGSGNVGGIVGRLAWGTILNSYSTGSVTGSSSNVGGLTGYLYGGTITNSYATSVVTGSSSYVGGLVGGSISGTISNSYTTGLTTCTKSSAPYNCGGLAGGTVSVSTNNSWVNSSSGSPQACQGTSATKTGGTNTGCTAN